MNTHIQSVHEHRKAFKCDVCHYRYSRKGHMLSCYQVHDSSKAFECDICDYSCSQKSRLNIQFMKEKNPSNVKHVKKNFRFKSELNSHIASVHEARNSFKCNMCDKSFSQKGNMYLHVETVHEGRKAFKCDICDQCYSQKSNLKTHIANNHSNAKYVIKALNLKAI